MGLRTTCLVVAGALMSSVAFADGDSGGNSGAADDTLEFGAITTYRSEGQAQQACGADTVIWADRYAGYLYFKREKEYGHTGQGAFACLKQAKGANYWSTGPMGGMAEGHGPGRNFPFKPIEVPNS